MWNHEWQKHGACGGWSGPEAYFEHTMNVADTLAPTVDILKRWASEGRRVQVSDIMGLYDKLVHLVYSTNTTISAIRSCYLPQSNWSLDAFVWSGALPSML